MSALIITCLGIIAITLVIMWPSRPWREPNRPPGGPCDGRGCLTEAQWAELDGIEAATKARWPQ